MPQFAHSDFTQEKLAVANVLHSVGVTSLADQTGLKTSRFMKRTLGYLSTCMQAATMKFRRFCKICSRCWSGLTSELCQSRMYSVFLNERRPNACRDGEF